MYLQTIGLYYGSLWFACALLLCPLEMNTDAGCTVKGGRLSLLRSGAD